MFYPFILRNNRTLYRKKYFSLKLDYFKNEKYSSAKPGFNRKNVSFLNIRKTSSSRYLLESQFG